MEVKLERSSLRSFETRLFNLRQLERPIDAESVTLDAVSASALEGLRPKG